MEEKLRRELDRDLPVIFAAGPTWPLIFSRTRLPLCRLQEGRVVEVTSTRAHYMTVVGLVDHRGDWLMKVASWGNFYYIRTRDYRAYAARTIPGTCVFYRMKDL